MTVHPVQRRRKRLAFAARFEKFFEPLCTLPVVPDEQSDARGLLWIQDGATYGTSDNRNLSVFVRGMLLDDDARDLLPSWAGFVGGVIESTRLTPTASREGLQRDDTWRAVRAALLERLVDGLAEVARAEPDAWRRVLQRHNEALLGASLCDTRLFDLLADSVRVPSSRGDLPVRSLVTGGRIHVALGDGRGFEEMLFRALKVPVARGDRYAVVPFLRHYVARRGGALVEIGTGEGDRKLFAEAALTEEETAWLTAQLADGEQLVAARFSPVELPLVVVPDREAELKLALESDQADKRISAAALALARSFTARIERTATRRLYVNVDNPAIAAMLAARPSGGGVAAGKMLRALKRVMGANDEQTTALSEALGELSCLGASLAATPRGD